MSSMDRSHTGATQAASDTLVAREGDRRGV
jgi:hypothetical protein